MRVPPGPQLDLGHGQIAPLAIEHQCLAQKPFSNLANFLVRISASGTACEMFLEQTLAPHLFRDHRMETEGWSECGAAWLEGHASNQSMTTRRRKLLISRWCFPRRTPTYFPTSILVSRPVDRWRESCNSKGMKYDEAILRRAQVAGLNSDQRTAVAGRAQRGRVYAQHAATCRTCGGGDSRYCREGFRLIVDALR